MLDFDLVVIGGSVALGFGEPFFAAVQQEVEQSARLDFVRGVRVMPVGLGADSPLVGAAAVARMATIV
jgi:glucokinase